MRFFAAVTFAFLLAAHLSPAEDLAPLRKPTSKPRVIIVNAQPGKESRQAIDSSLVQLKP